MKMINAFLFLLFLCTACNNAEHNEAPESETDIDAARNFLQAALRSKWDVAQQYMLQDSENVSKLNAAARIERNIDEKQGLWDASINIHSRKLRNDSVSIIVYSNSFQKQNLDTLKVVKQGDKWLVDFKYLFDHDLIDLVETPKTDTTIHD